MAKIKVCGLTRHEDIIAVNEAKPDFCGFIVEYPKSRRSVPEEQLRRLTLEICREVIPVGVFVNAPEGLPARLLNENVISMAQLHGQEDEEYIKRLRELTDKPIIKAFSIKTSDDIKAALASTADYILLDQGNGGTGQTFDWSLVENVDRPFFLAGGLGISNLEKAIERLSPWAVDLSSSLETEGKKDPDKIKAAVKLVRRIEAQVERT